MLHTSVREAKCVYAQVHARTHIPILQNLPRSHEYDWPFSTVMLRVYKGGKEKLNRGEES